MASIVLYAFSKLCEFSNLSIWFFPQMKAHLFIWFVSFRNQLLQYYLELIFELSMDSTTDISTPNEENAKRDFLKITSFPVPVP